MVYQYLLIAGFLIFFIVIPSLCICRCSNRDKKTYIRLPTMDPMDLNP